MNRNHEQSSEEIMNDTKKTRAEIEKNLEALEQRLSPDEMLDQVGQAIAPARDGAATFARNLGDTVRENPVPAAMIGIGLGWLLLSGHRSEAGAYDRPEHIDPHASVYDPTLDDANESGQGRMRETQEWARARSDEVRDRKSVV